MARTTVMWLILAAALAYLAAATALYFCQRAFIYHPGYTRVPASETDFSLVHDGLTLRGWVVNPGRSRAVLYFGGNADAIQTVRPKLEQWLPDLTFYLLAYRGYGASEGSPSEAALFGDALALYDYAKPRHQAIDALGRSLGTGVAIYLASQRPLERLALVTPFDSILNGARKIFPMFPVAWLVKDKYESWRYAPQVHCPVLALAAENDHVIPAGSTRRIVAALPEVKKFMVIPDVGHGDIVDSQAYAEALIEFMR